MTDKQARFGRKGKNKDWLGYKEHVSVDIQSGLINKVAVTSAKVPDGQKLHDICHDEGAGYEGIILIVWYLLSSG